jgi:hypothetical protein
MQRRLAALGRRRRRGFVDKRVVVVANGAQ